MPITDSRASVHAVMRFLNRISARYLPGQRVVAVHPEASGCSKVFFSSGRLAFFGSMLGADAPLASR